MTDDPILAAAGAALECRNFAEPGDDIDLLMTGLHEALLNRSEHWPWRSADDPPELVGDGYVSDMAALLYEPVTGGVTVLPAYYQVGSGQWCSKYGSELLGDVLGWLPLPGGE